MVSVTANKFLELVERSELVSKEQLERVLSAPSSGEEVDASDPAALAKRFVESGLLTNWQCDLLLEGRHKGFFLGKHKLLGHLGTGGMSSVYLAEHMSMKRRVAIKVLPQNRVADSSYLARFYREAQTAAALDHPNVVRAFDVDNEGNTHYLVMEFVEGSDLQRLVKQAGPLPFDVAADYIRQAAEGLQHAHAAGVVHRDIKPANLLVDARGVVKVLDMGLARFANDTQASLTLANDENVLGTADYLSPEQALNSHQADGRADIYSLGCTLYYLLTGQPPFPDGTLAQRLMKHQSEAPRSVFEFRPDAPRELVGICMRMMAKSPQDRYPTAADCGAALAGFLKARGSRKPGPTGLLADRPRIATLPATPPVSRQVSEPEPELGLAPGSSPSNVLRGRASGARKSTAMQDTATGAGAGTDKVPTARPGDRPEGSGISKARRLPVAKSLDSPSASGGGGSAPSPEPTGAAPPALDLLSEELFSAGTGGAGTANLGADSAPHEFRLPSTPSTRRKQPEPFPWAVLIIVTAVVAVLVALILFSALKN